jgi:hypothetical protein
MLNKKARLAVLSAIILLFTILSFLLFSSAFVSAPAPEEKFSVSFDIKPSLAHQVLYITITNLQDSTDNLNLNTILNRTDFNIAGIRNLKWYQSKM